MLRNNCVYSANNSNIVVIQAVNTTYLRRYADIVLLKEFNNCFKRSVQKAAIYAALKSLFDTISNQGIQVLEVNTTILNKK